MPMSSRFRKILGIAALLGLVFLIGFFFNSFYGNPVSGPAGPQYCPSGTGGTVPRRTLHRRELRL